MSFCAWGGGTLDKKESTQEESVFALYIDGIEQKELPTKESGSSFDLENSYCEEGATIEWDYETWSPVIKNASQTRTKCHLYFTKELWRQWVTKAKVDPKASTLNEFLENKEKVTEVFASEEATNFLVSHQELIEEIKSTPSYMDTTKITEETNITGDLRSEVVKIILDSTVLTNKQKYENGLPCYIFQNGLSFDEFINYRWNGYNFGALSYNNSITSTINLSLLSHPNACATQNYYTKNKIDITKYAMFSMKYNITNTPTNYHSVLIGIGKTINSEYGFSMTRGIATQGSSNGWLTTKISDLSGEYYFGAGIRSCDNGSNSTTASSTIYEWYVY